MHALLFIAEFYVNINSQLIMLFLKYCLLLTKMNMILLYYDLCKEMCIIIHLMYLYKGFVNSAQEMFLLVIASGPLSSVVSNPKLFSFNLFHKH